MSTAFAKHMSDLDNHIEYKIEMTVSRYTRQEIEEKCDIQIPIDIQTLYLLYCHDLLFVTFKLIELNKEIEHEMKAIELRTVTVEQELAEAKPALEAAQKAVSNINRKQLNEFKRIRNPPKLGLNYIV